ncbi:uncharacterized protein LOC107474945 [Arachis duranensis]|nr:uncharacterized protein LOC107474945 [Arachis duranensis]XP_025626198.1 uncharacterized protein LOC112719738 [Arachis hypogaea]
MGHSPALAMRTESWDRDEDADVYSEDEDYDPEVDEVESFDDHVDDVFAAHEAEHRGNANSKKKDTDFWEVDVIENGVIKRMDLTIKEALALPPGRKIVLHLNKEMQQVGQSAGLLSGFLGSLGADFQQLPICGESWRTMNKAIKEHVFDQFKRVFHYEDDEGGRIKLRIIQRIGRNWKNTRNNLFHKFYDSRRTFEQNVNHKPSGIDANHWKWFLEYRLKDSTKEKCRKNAANRAKQRYIHTGGSKTLARKRHEEEQRQGRPIGRGEIWTMTHKKQDGTYINEDARLVGEAIEHIESQDVSSKELSQNDSLSQVLGKEHPGRVRGMGFGPCPTQCFRYIPQQSASSVQVEDYQKEIAELKAEAAILKAERAEDKAKSQTMENLLRYLIQQQGGNLPPDVAANLEALGGAPTVSRAT